jgi:hypothetical protein
MLRRNLQSVNFPFGGEGLSTRLVRNLEHKLFDNVVNLFRLEEELAGQGQNLKTVLFPLTESLGWVKVQFR